SNMKLPAATWTRTALTARASGSGRQAYFGAGRASASARIWRVTISSSQRYSPGKPGIRAVVVILVSPGLFPNAGRGAFLISLQEQAVTLSRGLWTFPTAPPPAVW